MLLMLRSVLKQRVNIQFCILNESSATRNYPETGSRKLAGLVPGSRHLVRKSSTELTNNWQSSLGHCPASGRRGERHEPSTTLAPRRCRSIDRQPPLLPLEPGQLASICLAVSSAGSLDARLRRQY